MVIKFYQYYSVMPKVCSHSNATGDALTISFVALKNIHNDDQS